ncbi:glycosyltransferase family 2 protein [Candidatus Shapirobacteria bacterium CG10_big_fil_rev_8_21_14_0_10_40_9]|uniref:Glycosyltransferase family 2 protein n=1 Tax=Candidatus Shapirobacteria bacterium CG10_big_fil_rev_8_21_14_0_10_40_9 TaxID=1974888 RepID=A0A2M8L3A8_9BACT|nr:MAG: glycosyltransferase family 2 protein [Candidatus Shapirobacteria bacterium CG10_big_fil_rev_8_21_14_0_10_40_9]
MAKSLSFLSVFFPTYNDEKTIGGLVGETFEILPSIAQKYEVIVVNDGSTDNTGLVLENLAQKYKNLKIITHSKNRGYGGALKSGFENVLGDFVFYTDGDGQYDVGELPKLVEKMGEGIDLVNGYKIKRSDSLLRIISGQIYTLLVRLLLGIRFANINCDFRLFRRGILDKITLTRNSGAICAEMLAKIQKEKGVIISVPVHHYPRKFGTSQFFKPEKILKTILDDIWLWWKLK